MTLWFRPMLLLLPWGLSAARGAYAQVPPSPLPESTALAADQTPLYDPAQLPSFTGRVQQFTLTPRGEIDGRILSNGTEVKTAPALSTSSNASACRPFSWTYGCPGWRGSRCCVAYVPAISPRPSRY
jgi:hypothetical protein